MPFSSPSRAGGNGEFPPIAISGTAVAISNISKSARPFPEEQGFIGWGGARNRADRLSEGLSLKQATGIIEAAQFALAIGLPFNRHVTIHWERAGVSDNRAAAATARFLKLASDWLAKGNATPVKQTAKNGRGSLSFAWAWVRENDAGGKCSKGSHVHILLYLPASVTWGGWRVRRWLERISGQPYRRGIIRTSRIGGKVRTAADNTGVYQVNLAAVVGYMLKGTSPVAASQLGLEAVIPQGPIIGKRAATSQNVGRSARNKQTGKNGWPRTAALARDVIKPDCRNSLGDK